LRLAAALLAVAVTALIFQGSLAVFLPDSVVPDLVLLLAVSGAVALPPVAGVLLAVGGGYGADLLSGALLGQHALLRVIAFMATRAVASQFQLRRAFPLFVFVFVLAVADALLLAGLGRLFQAAPIPAPATLATVVVRALVTAALAPAFLKLVVGLRERLVEGETRREVRLETRRPVL
jgi:rod shape-determining protein MreD